MFPDRGSSATGKRNPAVSFEVSNPWLIVVLLLGFVFCGAAGVQRFVPSDGSLSIDEYVSIGVPELDHPWSLEEQDQALDALARLDREQLPRYESKESGALFERLLESDEARGDLLTAAVSTAEELILGSRSARILYALKQDDALLFDRELLELIAQSATGIAESLREAAELRERLGMREPAAATDVGAGRLERSLQRHARMMELSEAALQRELLALVELASFKATRESTRIALVERLAGLIPEAVGLLPPEGRAGLRVALRDLAMLDWNDGIENRLVALEGSIE